MNSAIHYGFIFLSLFLGGQLLSQSANRFTDRADTTGAANKGMFSGQVRYYWMATDNLQPLSDYHAHALSLQGKYETGKWKHFSLAAGASAGFNLSSSDLSKADPIARRPNRYEVGLFDLRYPDKKAGVRLEELYLQYTLPIGIVRLGSQAISTPFINLQDGRMRPTFVSGIYAKQAFTKTTVEGGWIGAVLPRSINGWYGVGSSIGLNPQGINTDGTASNYAGRLRSDGILLAGITHSLSKEIKVKAWEQFVENLFNAALVQVEMEKTIAEKERFLASLQYIHQERVKDGGSSESTKGYFQQAGPAQVISAMTGLRSNRFEASLNYTRIGKNYRYLMPREWGREPFFTFMPRERNEGFGDAQAFVIKTGYNIPKAGLKTSLQAGYFRLPDVKNVALNKYGMPSYTQLNAEVRYTPQFAPKLDMQALYVYKGASGNTDQNPAAVFNKVNMSLYNLVINYSL